MEGTDILGLVAGACVTIAVVPQIKKAFKTKKVDDVSPFMFLILIIGVFLWVVYGVVQRDFPIIITNGISLCLNGAMFYVILRYRKKQ
ncbi:MAG: SemiSWEET transporter [Sediminicola sp.]|tara:strand:+ start:147448 stop:147711 length:264 start_codon:yes stop_codon:yes gene_type:complete